MLGRSLARPVALLLALLLLAGCAAERVVPAGQFRADTAENAARIGRVVHFLSIANDSLCERSAIGAMLYANGQPACGMSVVVVQAGAINAVTDGTNIMLSSAMMQFTRNDPELAFIIAHELGHILAGHVTQKKIAYAAGVALDIAATLAGVPTQGLFAKLGTLAFSQAQEREADRYGAYLMARAGHHPTVGADLFRRMPPGGGGWLDTHPANAERATHLEQLAAEIGAKKDRGLPVLP